MMVKDYDIGWERHMSLPVNSKFTKLDKNVKFSLECSERLVSKPFLVIMIQNINVWTHLALVGHWNSLWNTR